LSEKFSEKRGATEEIPNNRKKMKNSTIKPLPGNGKKTEKIAKKTEK